MDTTQQGQDAATCDALMRGGSRSFFAASRVLPRELRESAGALYAWCRVADDAIDGSSQPQQALEELTRRLDALYAGHAISDPVDRAFAGVVERHQLPRALPEALLEGFAWDAQCRRYADLEALSAYAARVAGTVGAMMTVIMGCRAEPVLARACDLGVAMQYTNIARDVGEDARAGRLYLPLAWLEDAGIDPEAWLKSPVFDHRLAGVVQRLLAEADLLYDRSSAGIGRLPRGCQPSIHAARLLYSEIGRELERKGLDSVGQRAIVPGARKAWLLARALVAPLLPTAELRAPPLATTRFLVEAAARAEARIAAEPTLDWILELFERLERRDRPGAVT
jgi:phytoene synthase